MVGGGQGRVRQSRGKKEEKEGRGKERKRRRERISWHRESGKLGFITLGGLPGNSTEGEQGKEVLRAHKAVISSDHSGYWLSSLPSIPDKEIWK